MGRWARRKRKNGKPKVEDTTPPSTDPFATLQGPSKLTPEITQAICEAVKKGLHKKHIAWSVGIEADTLATWLNRGEANAPGDEGYHYFSVCFKKAQAELYASRMNTITEASEKSWQAAAWQLERLSPDEYSDPGKELNRLRLENDELRKLVPEAEGGDDDQAILARAAAIIIANEPARPGRPFPDQSEATVEPVQQATSDGLPQ